MWLNKPLSRKKTAKSQAYKNSRCKKKESASADCVVFAAFSASQYRHEIEFFYKILNSIAARCDGKKYKRWAFYSWCYQAWLY
tara:strand:- start:4463 stop:4711 length:249 start_codon:yes stop_codon:yes gene_type:complete